MTPSLLTSVGWAVALAVAALSATSALAGKPAPLAPTDLRCEYQTDPVGLDAPSPRFFWHVCDPRRGAVQTAYQILVATEPADLRRDRGPVWDTGKVASDRSIHVPYAGPPLSSRRRYYWKVRTWDGDDVASPYPDPGYFEMGLLSPDDWQARWIRPAGAGDGLRLGDWVWHPTARGSNTIVLLRVAFSVRATPSLAKAVLSIAADNHAEVYVNGLEVGRHDEWESLATIELTSALGPGRQVLAVRARNDEGPCGLLAGLRLEYADGSADFALSGPDWRAAAEAPGGWADPAFDDSAWPAAAVVGKYGDGPWGPVGAKSERAPCLRREFSLRGPVARARAYVTGLGLYELHINGARVGDDVLTPGWTRYDKRVQYQAYDVTSLLREGPNAVGALLGNGWWTGRVGDAARPATWEPNLRFLCQIEVEYADGGTEVIATGDTWKSFPSPILEDDFYDGETYDARLELPGWDRPGFDDSEWRPTVLLDTAPGPLVAQQGPTIQITQDLPAVALTRSAPGVWVFDFGQNMAGRARLKVRGPAGTRVQIRFAEVLKPDGGIYTDNYRSARATDVYILRGDGEEVWEPRFTYRGFRYAELSGYPGDPPRGALLARVLHSAAPSAGTFECSNDLLNRVWRNITWGQRSNMHSVPTDCPQRDERLGWTGDAQAFAATACWNMDMARFFAKWTHDLTDSQGPKGEIPDVAPGPIGAAGAPAWADAVVIVPWTLHLFYADDRIVAQNYEGMKAWVEYMRARAPGYLYEREGYGDWIAVQGSPKKPIGAAYFYYSTSLLADMAAALGRDEDAAEYRLLAARIADAFNAAYLDRDTNDYPGGTQTASLIPLYFGITPPDRREAVLDNIVRDLHAADDHLTTGFLGTAYLLPLLTGVGQHDLAYRVATQRTYPSWGYMVEQGATTIWELWNSDKAGPGMNSRNHFALGAMGRWLFEALAGINPDPSAPGFKRIIVRPRPVGDLQWARADYPSLYGLITSEWRHEGDGLRLRVTVPPNTSAVIHLPLLGLDRYTITESGKTVARDGERADRVTGLRLRGVEDGCAVFSAAAGAYDFRVAAE